MHSNKKNRPLKVLVENKTSFYGPDSEVSIYDTYEDASRVPLAADELLFCGMVTGKKVMHSDGSKNIDKDQIFIPHESFVIAPGGTVEIDFPGASLNKPTTCITVEIAKEKVAQIAEQLNDSLPMLDLATQWQVKTPVLHTHHSSETQTLLKRLIRLFSENHPDRNQLIDLSVSELIIRMLRHKTRDFLLSHTAVNPELDSLTAALDWITSTLSKPLDIQQLSRHSGMSRSKLFNEFKRKIGCSPAEFQQQLRLKSAAERIGNGESITAISYDLGFKSPSHFCHRFKNFFGCTASEFTQAHNHKAIRPQD